MSESQKLLAAQQNVCKYIENFYFNSTDKVGAANQTLPHFEARLQLLEVYWQKAMSNHDALLPFETTLVEEGYFKNNVFTELEQVYISTKVRIQSRITELRGTQSTQSASTTAGASSSTGSRSEINALPILSLPTFSGKQEDWESFRQKFCALVRNKKGMPTVAKLQHLLNAVQRPAALRLRGLEIVEANFEVAWNLLLRRYDNPHMRLYNALEHIIELPQVKARSAQDLTELIDRS